MTAELPTGSLPDARKVTEALSSRLCTEELKLHPLSIAGHQTKPAKGSVNTRLWLPLVRMLRDEVACEDHGLSLHEVI